MLQIFVYKKLFNSGGSIAFEEDGVYRIRGIVSLTVARIDKQVCNSEEYVIFTDVAQYLPWIEETIAQTDKPTSKKIFIKQGSEYQLTTIFSRWNRISEDDLV